MTDEKKLQEWREEYDANERSIAKRCYKDTGECCCICVNQVRLVDHETNDICGHGCLAFVEPERTVFCGDFEHGRCEMFIKN